MPRQDVPYGGAICRLRERIAEIFDKLGEKLHTINGVPGDGDGNVKIISGSSAVVISNDPTQNEIAVSLDTSQLPAAAVSSVNGQTGAVALTADDVPSDNGDVQTDIDNLEAADTTLQGNINAEALARQNADSTLQTNINAVLASIPDMSVTPDPYKGVERDAQGRAFAADPASGATDKTLVTANWISQTGAGRPNNVLHSSGSEDVIGPKNFKSDLISSGIYNIKSTQNIENTSTWRRLYYNNVTPANQLLLLAITPQKPSISEEEYGILMIGGTANNNPVCKWFLKGNGIIVGNFVVTYSTSTGFELWVKNVNENRGICAIKLNETNWGSAASNWTVDSTTANASFDYTTYPFYTVSS